MTTDVPATEIRHPSADYLEALYEIEEEGFPMVQAEIARWMGVSRPSVSEHVKRLIGDGLLTADGRTLAFTDDGRRVAIALVRRHRLAEHLLIDVIGLPWHQAHQEAEVWERVISAQVEERLVEILGDPGACPHGNPIPGSSHEVDVTSLVALKDVESGTTVTLRRLTEDLELELAVMRFLEESGLMPGASVAVDGVGPDGSMSLTVQARSVALGAELADNLWVEAAPA
ncbi:MAG TPA: metal-dependent transcriptional regulator [Actinomycetota bacterium]|nr:metal-dependent transcriptional regulator [Actinomycetota bacterium]